MEADLVHQGHPEIEEEEEEEEEEEYVLLDLDAVFAQVDISPNTPYILSGLDTPQPSLIIDDKLKLIGEYEDTMGACFVFTEYEVAPVVPEETGSSEAHLFEGRCIVDPNQAPTKEVKPVAGLHKILKFRLLVDDGDVEDAPVEAKA